MLLGCFVTNLEKSLTFLHVAELKSILTQLEVSDVGTKMFLINKIAYYAKTKKVLPTPKIPSVSLAKKSQEIPLHPNSLILKGAYKNDLKTRLFFKKLIGDDFHFTAFGIDWINDCWMNGTPPTYQEFADMWKKEYAWRKQNQVPPKTEWALINFVKNYLAQKPTASRTEVTKAWQEERLKQKQTALNLLHQLGFDIAL